MSAVLVGVGAPVAGQTAERAARPVQEQPDPQAGEAYESFSGYVGYVGADGVGASAAAPTDPDEPKAEPLGPVGENPTESPDVPGQDAAPADDTEFTVAPLPSAPDPAEIAAVESEIGEHGSARVIVMTRTSTHLEADLSASQVEAQHEAIAESLDGLQATLRRTGSRKANEYQTIPAAVYDVTAEGLDALLADPNVASVVLDGEVHAQLDNSTGVIDSDLLNQAGVLGDGFDGSPVSRYEVAIIDSGVDSGHNAFTGRIVREACFVTDSSCLGGTNSSTAAGSGEECTHSTDCDHGTHVAGIAAGNVYAGGHEGVARGAGIVAIKVAQDSPTSSRWVAQWSSITDALEHVLFLKNGVPPFIAAPNPNIVSVNMSIGGGLSAVACDGSIPSIAAAVNNLRAAGVATVIAAGNDGSSTQVSMPGCVANAVTVSATNNADVPAGFTNSNALTDFWAPGVGIFAPVPTDDNEDDKSGTSMAAPHVAGALALLRECVDGNGVPITNADAISDLAATGVNVTRNGVTRKRINVLDAATRNVNNNDFAFPEVLPANPGAGFNDFDFNVCADREAGEPGPFSVDNSVWWRWTPAATGTATISTEDGGGFATTFDTTLTVYTGNALNALTPVAFDDDSGTGLRSLVTFPVQAGTTYRVKVDGFGAANGLMNLHLVNGPPPTCQGVPATIVGTINNDVINGTNGPDVIVAGNGNDTINGFGGNDRICSDAGNDTINAGGGADRAFGGPGADVVRGDAGTDVLLGNAGGGDVNDVADVIFGGADNDTLDGWVGNDILDGGPGNDIVMGNQDIDTVSYGLAPAGVNVNLTAQTAVGGGGNDNLAGFAGPIENIIGSPFNDVLQGSALNNNIRGFTGNDQLLGRLGNDALHGEGGVDTASFSLSPAGVSASLLAGTAVGEGSDTLGTIENLIGSPFNDVLTGNAVPNVILGLGGDDGMRGLGAGDQLDGGLGNDTMLGGIGNDLLFGRAGNDNYQGEAGSDTAAFVASPAAVSVNLTAGAAAGEGADVLGGIENALGSAFNDLLIGSPVPNLLDGRAGNDGLRGLAAADILLGGDGNDVALGGDGNDQLVGAAGSDRLFGEAGNDSHNGGLGVDLCNGGLGLDSQVLCEVVILIP